MEKIANKINPAKSSIKLGAPTGVRISGVEMLNKRVVIALTYIHGIGLATAKQICDAVKISHQVRIPALTEAQLAALREYINKNYVVEGDKKKEVIDDIKSLISKGTYRGNRHKKGLPCRGQNTKNNAKTRKKRGGKKR